MTKYRATHIIDEAFDRAGIHHRIELNGGSESVCAGFAIKKGPLATIRFISRDDDNDVSVCLLGLFNDIPVEDWPNTLKTINKANNVMRYTKFCLDDEGDINVEYDIPVRISDDCLGQVACEIFCRMAEIVRDEYELLVRALYLKDDEDDEMNLSSIQNLFHHYAPESEDDDEGVKADDADNGWYDLDLEDTDEHDDPQPEDEDDKTAESDDADNEMYEIVPEDTDEHDADTD